MRRRKKANGKLDIPSTPWDQGPRVPQAPPRLQHRDHPRQRCLLREGRQGARAQLEDAYREKRKSENGAKKDEGGLCRQVQRGGGFDGQKGEELGEK